MKITKHKNKLLFPILIAVFLLVCGGLGIALKTGFIPSFWNNPSTTPVTKENNQVKSVKTDDTKSSSTKPSQVTTSDVPKSTTMVATITDLQEDSDGNIHFAGTVTDAVRGTCVITFSNPNDKPYVLQFNASTKNNDNTALCQSAPISSLNFSYLGEWKVDFHFYSNNMQASTTGIINIK